jgi:hypothetical protein
LIRRLIFPGLKIGQRGVQTTINWAAVGLFTQGDQCRLVYVHTGSEETQRT